MVAIVTIKVPGKSYAALGRIMRSQAMADALEPLADEVLEAARQDPNPVYVAGLRKVAHFSDGKRGRASWRIGAAPVIGERVEAKRGTLARALGRIG